MLEPEDAIPLREEVATARMSPTLKRFPVKHSKARTRAYPAENIIGMSAETAAVTASLDLRLSVIDKEHKHARERASGRARSRVARHTAARRRTAAITPLAYRPCATRPNRWLRTARGPSAPPSSRVIRARFQWFLGVNPKNEELGLANGKSNAYPC